MQFSIIIPTFNEESGIVACLSSLQALRSRCEIIVVDGGSNDNTCVLAITLADRIIVSKKGRAAQMNAGAKLAAGDTLLFLHADTILPANALDLIGKAINDSKPWGRFNVQLAGEQAMFKIIAFMMNLRSRLTGIATGDQAIFVKKSTFLSAGAYPDIALMEDIALSKALKKISPPICLKARAISSTRRWRRQGIGKTILLMWCMRLSYFFGADPGRLAKLYNRE